MTSPSRNITNLRIRSAVLLEKGLRIHEQFLP